jgi:hypothetical protein
MLKGLGIWLLILVCAVLNGALRETVLLPAFDKSVAFAISGLLLSICIVAISLVLVVTLFSPLIAVRRRGMRLL